MKDLETQYEDLGKATKKDVEKPGVCPVCKSENLSYQSIEFDECVVYPFTCDDCGHYDREWYNLEYIGHNID